MLKKCDYCGKEFETNLVRQRFCCKACHTKWHNAHDASHSWAEYTKRKTQARQRHLTEKQKAKQAEKEARKQAREKEQEACQNVMEALMNQISFGNYIDWLDENIPYIMANVVREEGQITASASQCVQIKLKLVKQINKLLEEPSASRPPIPAQWINVVKTWPSKAAKTFLKSFNFDLGPGGNEGESLDDGWILISIGEGVPTGAYWWAGYFNLGWKYIYPRTIIPKWDISLITGVKS